MYVFEYLRFNFKTQEFVMRLPIKTQIITQKCNAKNLSYLRSYGSEKVKNLEKRKMRSHIKSVKVRALFVKNKVRFARAEQLW